MLRGIVAATAVAALLLAGVVAGREPRPIRVGYHEQVFLVDRDGGARRLTRGSHDNAEPIWSHDSRRIAVLKDDAVDVLSPAGTVKHRIAHRGMAVAWSPDDERLAYVRDMDPRSGYIGALIVADLDGQERTIVPKGVSDALDWSRDGRTIYWKHGRPNRGQQSIWAVSSDGGEPHRLVTDVDIFSRVLVAPNGDHILFERGRGLWVARTAGGGERELISNYGLYTGYGWLADGRVFGGQRSSDHRPVVATLSGERRRLGVAMRTQRYDITPDGERVAWANVRDRHHSALVVSAGADGSDYRVLARFESKVFPEIDHLAWSPDGRRLATAPHRHFGD
jgi:Tol biopolymer transport system component